MSFYTSLSGLQSAQTDMSVISNNLANVSTNGFKKSRAQFADVIASSITGSPNQQIGSGSVTKNILQQFTEGSLNQSGSSLDLAISGDGFFTVKSALSGSAVNFTRNGNFQVNNDRYVTDAQGNYLQVYPVDGSGTVVATGLGQTINLRLPKTSGLPTATTAVTLGMNLNSNSSIPTGTFDRFDPTTYNQSNQTTIYDSAGNPLTMTTYFVKTSDTTWNAYNYVGDTQLGVDPANPQPIQLTFDATGALTSPSGATAFGAFTPSGSTTAQSLSLTFDPASTTQLASPFNVAVSSQDGAAVGQLEGVTVGVDGIVTASFSNGDSQALGKVVLANFANPTGLRQMGNSTWAATGLSGAPELGVAGGNGFGSLSSGMLEGSNVDITEELVNLIAAQRNFQANAKALDTASQIQQSIFQIQ